jgi:hypothetical protein
MNGCEVFGLWRGRLVSPLLRTDHVGAVEPVPLVPTLFPPLDALVSSREWISSFIRDGEAIVPHFFLSHFDLKDEPRPGDEERLSLGSSCILSEARLREYGRMLAIL